MINDTNESKLSKDKTEEALLNRLLAKDFLLKVIQAVIFSINTYEEDMIEFRKKNRWNYCHRMPMLSLLGDNHSLLLLHKSKRFIWIEETDRLII